MSDDKVTIGEVYRLCLEIRTDVKAQNGRVSSLERQAERIKAFGFFGVIGLGLVIDWLKHKLGWS